MTPGIHPMQPMEAYLTLPAASASLMRTLLDRCPAAAWFESYLNHDHTPGTNKGMDRGTIAHGILLEGSTAGVEVEVAE